MESITSQSIRGYEVIEVIGEGGFGAVYHAFQPAVKREVAIKMLLPHYANDPDFIRGFETEAELIARLKLHRFSQSYCLFAGWKCSNCWQLFTRYLSQRSSSDDA
jgi:serine/threonine protein kinase